MLGPTFRLLGSRAPLCSRPPLGLLAPYLLPGQAPRQVHHRVMVRELAPHPAAALESLLVEEMEEPRVEEVPRDGVVVRVSHCAVHWVDLLMMAGQYQQAPPLPYTPGMEYSGVVAAAPPSSPHQPGDQVYVSGLETGPRSYGPYQQFGGMASYSVAPISAIEPLPPGLDMAQAATLNGAYETAYHALVHCGEVRRGEVALIHGATGATGLAAIQLSSALGVDVVATGGSDEKLEVVRDQALGEGRVVAVHNYNSGSSLTQAVKAVTKGVDLVYDTVGGIQLGRDSLKCLKFGGRYCVVGWTSTPMAGGGRGAGADHTSANTLPTNLIMMKGAKVLGCPVAIHTNLDKSIREPRMASILSLVSQGLLRPHVSHSFPLTEAKAALQAKWDRKVVGGAVIDCN